MGAPSHINATVGELLEEWFALAGPGYSPKVARETRGVMDRNPLPFLGNVPLSKLGAADIDRPLAPATIRRAHGILHRALVQGVKWGWLSANPASSASPPRIPTPDINPPAPHELARLFALATEVEVDLADYILLAAATGARRSELIALRWPDLDLDKRTVWISRGIVLGNDGLVEKDTKTHAARRVSLDRTTVAAMTAHRARAEERARLCEHELDRRAFVFSNEVDGSECWYPDSVSRAFARLCRNSTTRSWRSPNLRWPRTTKRLKPCSGSPRGSRRRHR